MEGFSHCIPCVQIIVRAFLRCRPAPVVYKALLTVNQRTMLPSSECGSYEPEMGNADMLARALLAIALFFGLLCATEGGQSPSMKFDGIATTPVGWPRFCREYPKECVRGMRAQEYVPMTLESWTKIALVNWWVNHHITYESDKDHWGVDERWTFAEDGFGDCEDYALRKRLILVANGFPERALLMATVTTRDGGGHALLIVHAQTADYVLDIDDDAIHAWMPTTYRYDAVQSPFDPTTWLRPRLSHGKIVARR